MTGLQRTIRKTLEWYQVYNALYFGGKLPIPIIEYDYLPSDKYATTEYSHGAFVIAFNILMPDVEVLLLQTLLHEMIHVKLWKSHPRHQHGKLFKKEQRRLERMGALTNLW